jgi:putative tryptophan/tyrosine transport system substrate-binding protein
MRRREFFPLLVGTAAWPLVARAQSPVIGSLFSGTPEAFAAGTDAFRSGLKEEGYVEGANLKIEYRWGLGQYDKLPALAADLVERQVAVIVTSGGEPAALAAKAATSTIPIVFGIGGDPVKLGLVTSINRPGGNATGASLLTPGLERKRVEVISQLKPDATTIAVLVNPSNPLAELQIDEVEQAAQALGRRILSMKANRDEDIDAAFTALSQQKISALVVTADPFFYSRRPQLAALSARSAVVAIFPFREFAIDGGLMSYGTSPLDIWRGTGNYTGRILNGAKPADLPVQQATRIELVLNLKTAKTLGVSFPVTLLGRADEVIE